MPAEAADWARGLVRRGIGLAALLRAYRLGHGWFWDRWSQTLYERLADTDELIAAQDESSAFMFANIDLISDVLVGEYGDECERMMRSAEHLRVETVRSILAGDAIDQEVAGPRLGYELRRHHVALRVSSRGGELRGLERAAIEAAAALGAGEPLIVPSGVASLDVSCGAYAPPAVLELVSLLARDLENATGRRRRPRRGQRAHQLLQPGVRGRGRLPRRRADVAGCITSATILSRRASGRVDVAAVSRPGVRAAAALDRGTARRGRAAEQPD